MKRVSHRDISLHAIYHFYHTHAEIAEHFGVSIKTVSRAFKRRGVPESRERFVAEIRAYLAANPNATDATAAKHLDCPEQSIYFARGAERFAPRIGNCVERTYQALQTNRRATAEELSAATGCSLSATYAALKQLRPKPDRRATRAKALEHLNRSKQSQPLSP